MITKQQFVEYWLATPWPGCRRAIGFQVVAANVGSSLRPALAGGHICYSTHTSITNINRG